MTRFLPTPYQLSPAYPARNRVILLLSVKAGLRAKEIAGLTWDVMMRRQLSSAIHLRNEASKGRSGHIIPLNREVWEALYELFQAR